ncbi:MAG: aminopeptidase P family protein [Candidatus Izemoplasmatales bacterium]
MNSNLFLQHRELILSEMRQGSFAVFYSGSAPHKTQDQTYVYTPNRNFYYLTGLERENFTLVLLKGNEKTFTYLFIEEPSDYATKWLGRRLTKEEAATISGIEINSIKYVDQFNAFIYQQVLGNNRGALIAKPTTLYLDLYRFRPFIEPVSLTKSSFILKSYPEVVVASVNEIIDRHRMMKSKEEVDEIQTAISYSKQAIEAVMKHAKPGMNERELEAYYEYTLKSVGSKGVSFDSIIASGKNATVLHYIDNNAEIHDDSLVLMDLGALSNNYASDISRTFPVNGKFTDRQKVLYEIVLKANKDSIAFVKPGITWQELNAYAKNILATECQKIGLIKELSEIDKYYYHNVSHFLGLDVHDVGMYLEPLVPGLVLTIEPGLYVEEEGIGIRIEDNVLVTENGRINLSESILKEVSDIENLKK